jgi:hypothetical protein
MTFYETMIYASTKKWSAQELTEEFAWTLDSNESTPLTLRNQKASIEEI